MGDLTALIMSIDTLQLTLAGVATVGGLGFVAYKTLNGTKKELADVLIDNSSEVKTEENNIEDNYTVNTQAEISQVRPRLTENSTPVIPKKENLVKELIDSALVFDSYGSQEEALQNLSDAILKETNPKEKVRLHVIYKNYSSGIEKLSDIMARYPSFSEKEETNKVNLFEDKVEDKAEDFPVLTEILSSPKEDSEPKETESFLAELCKTSNDQEKSQKKQDETDTANFFAEFGALAQQIKKENEADLKKKQQATIEQTKKEEDCFDIWANYMSLNGGRMNLKNTFIHLENPWGTVAAIAELQEKINKEIGFEDGYQIPWAIISVLPIRELK